MPKIVTTINEKVIAGDDTEVALQVQQAIAAGIDPGIILNDGLISAMNEVGKRFERGEYFVTEMLMAARAMKAGLEPLQPLLIKTDIKPLGKVVIGTVKGDLHDIGKNLVAVMMEGVGLEIVDLGVDVSADRFVDAARAGADIVAISALLTTTMQQMKTVIAALNEAGLRNRIKIMVGGAPVTEDFAHEIGADGYGKDAGSAARLAKELIGAVQHSHSGFY